MRLRDLLSNADLAAFDEVSMLGKGFIGKILFRAEDASPDESFCMTLLGLDCILAGHLAQAQPIGDDPVYRVGPCKGKGLNLPPESYSGPTPPSFADFVSRASIF